MVYLYEKNIIYPIMPAYQTGLNRSGSISLTSMRIRNDRADNRPITKNIFITIPGKVCGTCFMSILLDMISGIQQQSIRRLPSDESLNQTS
jgi:hypothetical protein